MQYEFSIGSFFVGLLILAAGVAFVKWYQPIADNLGSGVASYDRFKLAAFITCGLGFVVMLNLHTMLLTWLFSSLFSR
jgi:hypothetical protein